MDSRNVPRVLIVDDDPDDCVLATHEIKRSLGECDVTTISTRTDLRRALQNDRFDVVVTDYHLGSTNGMSVLGAARRRWPEIPVIMFAGASSGSGSLMIAVEGMKAGLNDYIPKSARHRGRLGPAVRVVLDRSGGSSPSTRAIGDDLESC